MPGKSGLYAGIDGKSDASYKEWHDRRPEHQPSRRRLGRGGEGWVAEETLAISIYCAVKYPKDFSRAIIAAVNHDGDSDSTGAVTGNIVGAALGYQALPDEWKENLECRDVILKAADELFRGPEISEIG